MGHAVTPRRFLFGLSCASSRNSLVVSHRHLISLGHPGRPGLSALQRLPLLILGDRPPLRLACTFVSHVLLRFLLASLLIVSDTSPVTRSFQLRIGWRLRSASFLGKFSSARYCPKADALRRPRTKSASSLRLKKLNLQGRAIPLGLRYLRPSFCIQVLR